MAYDYVRRTYNVDPQIGQRVKHTVTGNDGVITREDRSAGHYVQVRFDGKKHPCRAIPLNWNTAQKCRTFPTQRRALLGPSDPKQTMRKP